MNISHFTAITVIASTAITGLATAIPQELIDGLGDESFQQREKAQNDLSLWAKERGESAYDELNEIKKKSSSPEVKSRLDSLMSGDFVYKAITGTQGFMGIIMQPILGGSVITSVSPETPADRAGLKPNDTIIELDGIDLSKKNSNLDEATEFLRMYVKSKKAGEKLSIKIERDGEILSKSLKLADYNTEISRIDPFGQMGGVQILPMQGARVRVVPNAGGRIDPRQLKNNQRELLELNLRLQEQLQEEMNDQMEEMLKLQKQRNQQRADEFKLQLRFKMQEKAEEKNELKK